jgi:hypothetical protein
VRSQGPEADRLADQAAEQERQASQALAALDVLDVHATEFEPLLTELVSAGIEHIEFEEEQVWPMLRQAISPLQAAELGSEIAQGRELTEIVEQYIQE